MIEENPTPNEENKERQGMKYFLLVLGLLLVIIGGLVGFSRYQKYQRLAQSCLDGNTAQCLKLGRENFDKKNYAESTQFFEAACYNKLGVACFYLGLAFERIKKIEDAKVAYLNACDLDFSFGCTVYAPFAKRNEWELYYSRSCELQDPVGCSILGSLYSQDKEIAVKYYKKACDLHLLPTHKDDFSQIASMHGCVLYGIYSKKETFSKPGLSFLEKKCQGKTPEACYNLACIYSLKKEDKKALDYLQQ
ncbi:MAG: sel1 repeat family protein, partial [Halobacteriovoraceae bacterium]|nr:sel1 repeat family protein [Halobacteriovoraceae bacterium]